MVLRKKQKCRPNPRMTQLSEKKFIGASKESVKDPSLSKESPDQDIAVSECRLRLPTETMCLNEKALSEDTCHQYDNRLLQRIS